jgi:hypothetical protein
VIVIATTDWFEIVAIAVAVCCATAGSNVSQVQTAKAARFIASLLALERRL